MEAMALWISWTEFESSRRACLNSASSVLRKERRSSMLVVVAAMSVSSRSISPPKRPPSPVRRVISAAAFSMAWLRSSMSFLFLFSAPSQRSRCSMSARSSLRSSAIIVSIDARTLSKWPPFLSSKARRAKPRFLYSEATLFSLANAAERSFLSAPCCLEESCKNMVVCAASKVFMLSGSVKMLMAWEMPVSSSVRRRVRTAHSLALVWQPDFVSAKKASSASSCALVSSRISLLSANFLVFWASSPVCWSKVACKVSDSLTFVAISASKAFWSSASAALAFSMSPMKVSYMPFRMPWICVDCGA
mmetsp:Transcript_120856/g.385931  ORF Transcript_120856/g.385931 Transcript_120856/m.385931 type:complete len:305 (+) Transcript_120856:758-1672(+)